MEGKELLDNRFKQLVAGSSQSNLADIFENKIIIDHAKTKSGELSDSQKSIVGATVSLMQDRIIETLHSHKEQIRHDAILEKQFLVALVDRTAGIRQELSKLYNQPFIKVNSKDPSDKNDGDEDRPNDNKALHGIFSWGNVLAIFTAVLFGVALYTTNAYSNYKDIVALQKDEVSGYKETIKQNEKVIEELNVSKKSLSEKLKEKEDESALEKGKYTALYIQHQELKKNFESLSKSSGAEAVLKSQLDEATDQLADVRENYEQVQEKLLNLTRQKTEASGEASNYKSLYKQYKNQNKNLEKSVVALKKDNEKLQKKIEKLKDDDGGFFG